jgi:hypothetical protein
MITCTVLLLQSNRVDRERGGKRRPAAKNTPVETV